MKITLVRHGEPNYAIDSLTPKGFREAELLADLAANDITAEARSLYNPWSYYCQAAFRDLAWA